MNRKIRVGILFGGKSAEHEVSLNSARNVLQAIDKNKYEPVLIGIDKKGRWLMSKSPASLLDSSRTFIEDNVPDAVNVALVPQGSGEIENLTEGRPSSDSVDVVFPVLHGPLGEDGTVQGLLKLANIPFVGASVLGSAIGMDKDVMKRLLHEAGIPTAKILVVREGQVPSYEEATAALGSPVFVKPANLGSSVGIAKVKDKEQFDEAVADAFRYDSKILIEEYVKGRELECSVLGNDQPVASLPGELIPTHEFYSYEAKYLDENGAIFKIPADLPLDVVKRVQELAVRTYTTLCCEGMGRVDFFLKDNEEVIVNEINTIPGFTSISIYPKLWEASGVSYSELVDRLIQLALERFSKEQMLKTSR